MSVSDFRNRVKKAFGDSVSDAKNLGSISTGSYDVDRAYGKGLTRGRFHLWAGKESTGKTSLAIHTMREVNSVNWDTGERDETFSNPSPVLFVDLEGTFDESWARKIGVRDFESYNYIVRPADGDTAADIILTGIEDGSFALIIVDSNEAFVPKKTLEKSAEDAVMCDRAKILSRVYRVGTAHLNKFTGEPWRKPTVLCLNQNRDHIGTTPGAPTIPGGRAQLGYSSSIVQFGSPLVADDSLKSYGLGEFKGVTKKNKVHPPKKNFLFKMALRDLVDEENNGLRAGQIDNAASILKDVKELELLRKVDGGYEVFGDTYRTQSDFKTSLRSDPEKMRKIWKNLLEMNVQ